MFAGKRKSRKYVYIMIKKKKRNNNETCNEYIKRKIERGKKDKYLIW